MNITMLTEIISSGVAFAIPLLLAASGESISERAGVLNLSMEGMMLTGAFASVLGSVSTGSAVAGALTGLLAGLLFGALEAGGRQMQVDAGVSIDMISIIQALIIIFVAAPLLIKRLFPPLFRNRVTAGGGHE